MNWKIPLFKIYWDQEDVKSVVEVMKTGMNWAAGPTIEEFETMLAEYIGTKYCVAFNSGTSALHGALLAHGITEGDQVIVSSFTFIATANAPLFVGAKPVFAEIEDKTYGLDPEDVKERITKKTKALMPIHYGGCPCLYMKELKEVAEDYHLLLIEDAAESLGAKIENDMVGTFGDSGMISFCQNKVITTGEGGVVVTNSKKMYEKLRLLVSHGRSENKTYFSSAGKPDYVSLGYNFRMPTLSAALGVSQLKKIKRITEMRREVAVYYTSDLARIDGVKPPVPPEGFFHVYQMYTIEVDDRLRDKLKDHLAHKGILSKVYFDPIHLTTFYRKEFGFKEGDLPVTEEISKRVLTLPLYPMLKKEQVNYVVESIKNFMEGE